MPKRLLKQHVDNTIKIRRKSVFIDSLDIGADVNGTNDHQKDADTVKPVNHMQYLKLNQDNEIERLLVHNSKELLYLVDHSDFPAFNVGIWPQETNDILKSYPSCAFSVPRPIYVSDKQCEKFDICYKRPLNRDFYKKNAKVTRSTYKTALKSNKNIRSCIKEGIYQAAVFDMAERVYKQPDPFFESSYDFYFTGGNLCVLPHNGNIAHTGGQKLQDVSISKFREQSDSICLEKVASLNTSENCEIFEVHPLALSLNSQEKNCFIARQRNLVSFNYLKDNNQIKTVTQFRTKSTPFISFAQSQRDINNMIITTMKQHVRLYDLNSSVPSLVKVFKISPNSINISWNTVKPWRENTFMYANERQFFMMDIRSSPEQWLSEVTFTTDSLICDHISAVLPSDFNNLFYLATNHKLMCMDIRYVKKYSLSDPEGVICRWSHQLRYAPLMIDTFRLPQTEYIALSSPIAGDLHICQLSRERNCDTICLEPSSHLPKHIYHSPCLPYQPPTLFEAFDNARFSGKCLNPEVNMESRLKCCTTGMKFFKTSLTKSKCEIGLLLTANSNGDIFAQSLSKREQNETEERCNLQSDAVIAEYERKISKKTPLPLNYTEIKNMRGLRKVFLCKSLSAFAQSDVEATDNECNDDISLDQRVTNTNFPKKSRSNRLYLGRWQKSITTLKSYKDALAAELLSVWDIDEEGKNIHLEDPRCKDSELKVQEWFKRNVHLNPPVLSTPQEVIRDSAFDTSHIFDNTANMSQIQNSTIDFEIAVHSTQRLDSTLNNVTNVDTSRIDTTDIAVQRNDEAAPTDIERLRNKKKIKKYVKGF